MASIEVGQKVWLVEFNRRAGREPHEPLEATVKKVGRKYFELENNWMGRFHVSTLLHDGGGYSPRARVYLNIQEYIDQKEASDLYSELRQHFTNYDSKKLTLDQLRKIKAIITPTEP